MTLDIPLVAARRGSLIISEIFIYSTHANGPVSNNGHYMEMYNNGDTTVYLDGMLFFRTSLGLHSARDAYPCPVNAALRLDPDAIWASTIERFPGSAGGRTLPIAPGGTRIWALNAIDHTSVASTLHDLRAASFESIGNDADPNNPAAMDMIPLKVGGLPYGPAFTSQIMIGLALPIAQDTTQMERGLIASYNDGALFPVFRIPREAIVDVMGERSTPEVDAGPSGWPDQVTCVPFTSSNFDNAPAPLVDFFIPKAISRKSLGRTADGREILQRTRNSARDFRLADPLRRSLLRIPQ
jgi:hypothetical protein